MNRNFINVNFWLGRKAGALVGGAGAGGGREERARAGE